MKKFVERIEKSIIFASSNNKTIKTGSYIMETKKSQKSKLEQTAIAAIRSIIAYRTELDNEFFSHPDRFDENVRNAFLDRYCSLTEMVNEINRYYNPLDNPLEKKCVTLQ